MRRLTFIPQSSVGKWAAGATGFFLVLTAASQFLSRSLHIENGVAVLDPNISPILAVLGVTAFVFGILALILGVASLFKKDFSLFVLFAVALGLFPIFFLVGRFILPR